MGVVPQMVTFVNKGTWLVKNGQKSAYEIYERPLTRPPKPELEVKHIWYRVHTMTAKKPIGSWITWFISSWEENNCYVKLSKFTKLQLFSLRMKTLFIKDNFDFWVSFCEFCQLYTTVILFSAWDKSRDLGANWSKLDTLLGSGSEWPKDQA